MPGKKFYRNNKGAGAAKKPDSSFSGFARNAILQTKQVGHVTHHNALQWVDNWVENKLGEYSKEIALMGKNMKFTPYDAAAERAKFVMDPEVPESLDCWRPTPEQRAVLIAIVDPAEREDSAKSLAIEWVIAQKARNAAIRTGNITKSEQLKKVESKTESYYRRCFKPSCLI